MVNPPHNANAAGRHWFQTKGEKLMHNEYLIKQAAAAQGAAYVGYQSNDACGAVIKQTAIEEAISHVELMRQQVNLISADVAAFLDRAAGGALNGIQSEKEVQTSPPQPHGQLPRLGTNLKELKWSINTLSERISKLSQIA